MEMIRRIITEALSERAKFQIKVRQPLALLKVKNPKIKTEKELLELIKEEVNVKEISFDQSLESEAQLEKGITKELKEEGVVREIIRHIQKMRKEAGLTPKEEISIVFSAPPYWNQILEGNQNLISQKTKARDLKSEEKSNKVFEKEIEIKVDKEKLWIAIKRL